MLPHNNTDTSIAAAKEAEEFAESDRARILSQIRRQPMANHELADCLGIKLQTVCARINGLARDGLITDSGRRTKTPSNRSAKIWEAVEPKKIQAGLF